MKIFIAPYVIAHAKWLNTVAGAADSLVFAKCSRDHLCHAFNTVIYHQNIIDFRDNFFEGVICFAPDYVFIPAAIMNPLVANPRSAGSTEGGKDPLALGMMFLAKGLVAVLQELW